MIEGLSSIPPVSDRMPSGGKIEVRSMSNAPSMGKTNAAMTAAAVVWLFGCSGSLTTTSFAQPAPPAIWTVPEIGALPNNAHGRQVRRGRDLITATYAYIGPEVPNPAKRFAGNNLACSNCHLQAGTKKFGIPLFCLFGEFPLYSARLGAVITI